MRLTEARRSAGADMADVDFDTLKTFIDRVNLLMSDSTWRYNFDGELGLTMLASGNRRIGWLRETLQNIDDAELDIIVYNARNPTARKLADWWEEQKEWQERVDYETQQRNLRESGLKKLTVAERHALGLANA